jgi:DNA-binding MarR family transcriptional regulator
MTGTSQSGTATGIRRFPKEKSGWKFAGVREWQAERLLSHFLRTSIRLQRAFDESFNQFGMTAQSAALLVLCVEEGQTSASDLAQAMSRDIGKITRFIDKLEYGGFVSRKRDRGDHRLFIIKPTTRGRRLAPRLRRRFGEVRNRLVEGVFNSDADTLEAVLAQLLANAERLCAGRPE